MKNMIKNRSLVSLTLLIVVLLFATGCVSDGRHTQDIDIHTGTDGIIFGFLEKAPPAEVYGGSTFKAVLDLRNYGVEDVRNGLIVFGIEKAYISMEGESFAQIDVEGKETNFEGGRQLIEKTLFVGRLDPQMETLTTTLTATACYPYKTTASPLVCIDTDIYGLREQRKSCTTEEVSLSGGQGGPIAVTAVIPKMVPQKENPDIITPQFEIKIANMGEGQPINPQKYVAACTGESLSVEDWNTVNIRAKFITGVGTEYLNCKPKRKGQTGDDGYFKLKGQTEFVRCIYEKGVSKAMGTYSTPLIIELEYGYVQSKSRTILIKKEKG